MFDKQEKKSDSKEYGAIGGQLSPPAISLPKGGGAIRGIDEKFSVNPATGTSSLTVPISTTPGRSDFYPKLSLSYDSGAGNGPFGLGWNLSIPLITRKTDKGIPRYQDAEESDTFILSGAEDLVPSLMKTDSEWIRDTLDDVEVGGEIYTVQRYRPRIEGLFARIERWQHTETGDVFWKSISRDNVTSIYGKSPDARIFDPEDEFRVFKWMLEATYDDKGNAILYEYKQENADGIDPSRPQEKNRLSNATDFANKYLKRIHYGNREPYKRDEDSSQPFLSGDKLFEDCDWLFEVVFDYGEHDLDNPGVDGNQQWPCRPDPFSGYRAGFEIRTYRLCRRVLMFHHFEELGSAPCLVRSTDFTYDGDPVSAYEDYARVGNPVATYLESVTQTGYVRDDDASPYTTKSLPPLEFSYTKPEIDEEIRFLDPESLENLPNGLDGSRYRWVDLDGEGVSDILTQQADAWFYKRNMGEARFAPVELLATKPSLALLQGGQQQFVDLAGDGQLDLVQFVDPVPGFYERSGEQGWNTFRAFKFSPNIDWNDPNLRLIDLNGDGHADILVSEDEAFVWYPSLGEQGFGPAETVRKLVDEEEGPTLVFADATQSVYLADLSGDGLIDIARIRNGEICYWPNLGYGRFGAKVTMDKALFFDHPDLFDQKRIRLADIDGSGTTDIIYLDADCITIWFNQAGNSWSPPRYLKSFPRTDNLSSVTVLDLLGNGTGCIVWSSPLPGDSQQPMRYMDLMGGVKPHLLKSTRNNMGAETRMTYAPSTKFYLEDLTAGKPWITRLPFPVHVLERVETYDWISRNRFVTRYAYHHGYYDGIDREFRGFGMVEQWDTEEYAALEAAGEFPSVTNTLDESSHVPPVLTRTWFHTGAYLDGTKISRQFEEEYYREGDPSLGETGLTDEQLNALLLEDTLLPTDLSPQLSTEEAREACRALKGSILRQEIYARDGTEEADRPYSVSERNYTLKRLQPQDENQHAVFFAHPCETIDFHYERKLYDIDGQKLADPRITHTMTLAVDEYGNVERSVAIAYRRRELSDVLEPEQTDTHITFTVNRFANCTEAEDWYRVGLPVETRTYEMVNPPEPGIIDHLVEPFRFQAISALTEELFPPAKVEPNDSKLWSYERWDWRGNPENAPPDTRLRPIEHLRTLYRHDDLTGPLQIGEVESLALPYETYKLAFTPGLIAEVYGGRVTNAMLENDGRYVHSESDANWWIPSGQVFYSPTPAQELDYAQQHFFLPRRIRDPFGESATVDYDEYDLLITRTTDPLENTATAESDYRVLQPRLLTDPNGNRSAVAFDALGMVVGTAVKGKASENKGDSLAEFQPDLTPEQIDDFFNAGGSHNPATTLLGNATSRIIYNLDRFHLTRDANPDDPTQWEPVFAATLARETHVNDPLPPDGLKIQISFSYSDGFGREIQQKIQAEPGPIVEGEPDVDPRWVGSGWTIFNNKGKPVRQYEPFFSDSHCFEFAKIVGVSPILFYDPLERVVATLHPNHTYEKVVFDPWRQETWDVNDTVLQADPKDDPDVGDFFRRLAEDDYLPTWHQSRINGELGEAEKQAAAKAAKHANTPTVAHFDTPGRTFLTVADNGLDQNGTEQKYLTCVDLDIEGNQRKVIDALGRTVMTYDYDMLGNVIHTESMDAGKRWMLNNVAGNPIRLWDSRSHEINYIYDALLRPTHVFVSTENAPSVLTERMVYGEGHPSAEILNLRGNIYQQYDGAGVVTNEEFDFKGNLLRSTRRLARNERSSPRR